MPDLVTQELNKYHIKKKGNISDEILPVNPVIDFLLDNPDQDKLIKRFIAILRTVKEYNFAIEVFKQQTDIEILKSLRTIDRIEAKNLIPNQNNRNDLKLFTCESIGLIVRKITDTLFYCADKPRAFFFEKFDSMCLAEIVD